MQRDYTIILMLLQLLLLIALEPLKPSYNSN